MRLRETDERGRPVFIRQADTADDRSRLDEERRWLEVASHPGVTALVRATEGELVTERPGRALPALGALTAEEVAGLGAVAATTLADLHDLGIAHGHVCAGCLLVGSDGRPTWSDLSAAHYVAHPADAAGDVTALAGLLQEALPGRAPSALLRALRQARAGRNGTARALAARLAAVPGARLPERPDQGACVPERPIEMISSPRRPTDPTDPTDTTDPTAPPDRAVGTADTAPPSGRTGAGGPVARHPAEVAEHEGWVPPLLRRRSDGRSWRRGTAVALIAALILGVALEVVGAAHHSKGAAGALRQGSSRSTGLVRRGVHPSPPAPASAAPMVDCPVADAGCDPLPMSDGVLTADGAAWRLYGQVTSVVLGRWTCGQALPAVLQGSTNEVWAFGSWAGARSATASLVGWVPEAVALRTVPVAGGCDRLAVLRRTGPPVVLRPSTVLAP